VSEDDAGRPRLRKALTGLLPNGRPPFRPYVYRGTGRDENPETNPALLTRDERYRGGTPGVRNMPKHSEPVSDGAAGTESEHVRKLSDYSRVPYTEQLLFDRVSTLDNMGCGFPHRCGGDEELAPRGGRDRARGTEDQSVRVIQGNVSRETSPAGDTFASGMQGYTTLEASFS
jgi:hypothetical protein